MKVRMALILPAALAAALTGLTGWVFTRPALGAGAQGSPALAAAPAVLVGGGNAGPGGSAGGAGARSGDPGATTSAPDAPASRTVVDPTWAARIATATGIPEVAVSAYADATLSESATDATCGLSWNTLAGIGDIESGHGTHGGAHLEADGEDSAAILGPALDGKDATAAVANTDPAVDGAGPWARAVGPLQFLPSTWARWGADGNGDGIRDPNNIVDAAFAAAHYLCAGGGDLTTGAGWTAAILSYNHETSYVDAVRAAANTYAREAG